MVSYPSAVKYVKHKHLPKNDRKIVNEHILMSSDIAKWNKIQQYLINQIHRKKSTHDPENEITDLTVKEMYNTYLLFGEKYTKSLWYDMVRYTLGVILERSIESEFDCLGVYYHHENYTESMLNVMSDVERFSRSKWRLDKVSHLTVKDIQIITGFRDGLISMLNNYMRFIFKFDKKHDSVKLKATRNCGMEVHRIMKVTGYVLPTIKHKMTSETPMLGYSQLPERDREIVKTHILISAEFEKWYGVQSFLIDQMKETKSAPNEDEQFSDSTSKLMYNDYLFFGREHGQNIWLNKFSCYLKFVLEGSIESKFDCLLVYYKFNKYTTDMLEVVSGIDVFDKKKWKLDKGPHMSVNDIHKIANFRDCLIEILSRCLPLIRDFDLKHDPNRMLAMCVCGKELARIKQYTKYPE